MTLNGPRPATPKAAGPNRAALAAVWLAVLISVVDYTVVNVALPTIGRDIHATASASIWVVNAYQLTNLILLLPMAALGERLGHAKICRFGLILFLVASALCAAAHTLPELTAARVLQGIGGACILSVNVALIRFIYPDQQFGRGIAYNGLVIALGVALGPTTAAAVLSVAGWPWLFLINLPLGLVALILSTAALPATPRTDRRFDVTGAILLGLAFGALLVGCDDFAHRSGLGFGAALVALGAASFFLLIRRMLSVPDPLLPVDLLGIAGFRTAFLVGHLAFIASNFFLISMPFTLEGVLHRSAVATGLLMTPWPVAIVLSAPAMSRIADRFSAATLSSAGLCVTATGFLLLRFLSPHASDLDVAWRIGLAGLGFGLFQPPNNKAMVLTAPTNRVGGAGGMVAVARLLGQTLGAMFVAVVFGLVVHRPTAACLSLAAATALAGAALSATRLRRRPFAESLSG